MHEEKKKRFRALTKRFGQGLAEILIGRGILVKRRVLGWERSERDWDIWFCTKSGQTSNIYIENAAQ